MRGYAIEALAGFGERIVGTLGMFCWIRPLRRRATPDPSCIAANPCQRSVDVLFQSYNEDDLYVRTSVLKAFELIFATRLRS